MDVMVVLDILFFLILIWMDEISNYILIFLRKYIIWKPF